VARCCGADRRRCEVAAGEFFVCSDGQRKRGVTWEHRHRLTGLWMIADLEELLV
jgi:hypothetical protein